MIGRRVVGLDHTRFDCNMLDACETSKNCVIPNERDRRIAERRTAGKDFKKKKIRRFFFFIDVGQFVIKISEVERFNLRLVNE